VSIPLVDLVAQYDAIKDEVTATIDEVLRRGVFILGPNVTALEEELAAYCGTRFAIGVASGTDALILTLRAMGIGPGDEVVVPAYTFFASAEAVSLCGARPVFVDIDPATYGLDPNQVEDRLSPRTRAIIPVHLYGHPAEMDGVLAVAARRGIRVIEDNAQAIGASYHGRRTGGLGDAGCLSFFPSKNLGAYGDAGMVVTSDPAVAEAVRKLRTHGWTRKYFPEMIGMNSRLDELQAAVLRVKLRHLDAWTAARRRVAARYRELLADVPLGVPAEAPDVVHVYHLFVLRVAAREAVRRALAGQGIASAVYYPLPLHRIDPYRSADAASYPEAERAAEETLAIPLYPEMTEPLIHQVAGAVREAVNEARAERAGR
jgi:dTDP-4-amino-4,6-dideoxygalactose transaminase